MFKNTKKGALARMFIALGLALVFAILRKKIILLITSPLGGIRAEIAYDHAIYNSDWAVAAFIIIFLAATYDYMRRRPD